MDMIQKLKERRAFLENQKVRVVQMASVIDGAIAENTEMLKILETPPEERKELIPPPETPVPPEVPEPAPIREKTVVMKPKKGKQKAADYAQGGE